MGQGHVQGCRVGVTKCRRSHAAAGHEAQTKESICHLEGYAESELLLLG